MSRAASGRVPVAVAAALAALATLGCVPSAGAETLTEAWKAALAGDLSLHAAANRVAAAEQDLGAARAERGPEVTAGANALTFDETPTLDFAGAGIPARLPLFSGSTWVLGSTQLAVPLYTGGATRNAIGAAAAGVEVQRHAAAALTQQVKLQVAERYLDVLRASSALDVARSDEASLEAHLADVEDMYRSGSVPRTDFLAASVSLAEARQRTLTAENGVDLARAAYNRALGRELTAAVELDSKLPPIPDRIERADLGELTSMAIANREELDRLDAAAAALDSRAQAARAASRPRVGLTGGYNHIDNDILNRRDFWSVGVGVEWRVFDNGRARDRAAALELESAAARDERRNLESVVRLDVRQAWLSRAEAERRVELAAAAVDQADENLRVATDRYRMGEGTNTDVLGAEALRRSGRSNLDNARYDAALARYRLARAVGVL